ncbi:MAG: DNA polymerase III subunit delta [Bacilli bacterium]|nr:DNA polymerase III subunit delta [Bacilli bacterium]
MTNNYIIVSDDKVTIDNYINKIIKDNKLKDFEIIKYDYPDVSISTVLEELNTYNFLSNIKLIVYNNCSFLSKDKDKGLDELKKYVMNPSDNYFVMINDVIDDKKDIFKCNIELLSNKVSSELLIKNNLEGYVMDSRTIKYLADYCLNNNEKILNELDKIKCYKMSENDKNITKEDIDNIAIRDYDEDIYDLVNAIAAKNKDRAFDLYTRISKKEKDSVNIIASISSQIRMLYSVKILTEKKYKPQDIATILGVKPYAVTMALENCNNYSTKKLLSFLNTLADIDYKSKSGLGRGNILFEIFLLNI